MIVAPLDFQPSASSRIELRPLDSSQIESKRFSFRAAKELVRDLHRPKPKIYWFDFFTSNIAGHALPTINVRSDQ
ncbi:MAG: hypothetical protein FJ308_20730 [Planctomycetes bacterium]|nr:hypothetical protein [Planctomycetota bacterium]